MFRSRARAFAVLALVGLVETFAACRDDSSSDAGQSTSDAGQATTDGSRPNDSQTDSATTSTDAPTGDAGSSCTTKSFGAPQLVMGLDNAITLAATLSSDEKTIIVSQHNDTTGGFELGVATRGQIADPFGAATALVGINDGFDNDERPSLTADGLTLYFQRDEPFNYSGALYKTTRSSTALTFNSPTKLTAFEGGFSDGLFEDPFILPDGKSLYYVSWAKKDVSPEFQITKAASGDAGVGSFAQGALVAGVNGHANQRDPVITPDELTAFYAADIDGTVGNANYDILMSTRATTNDPFGGEQMLTTLNSSAYESPMWLSPDECRLYFVSTRDGDGGTGTSHLYVTSR